MIIDSPIISGSYLSTGSLSQTGNVSITGSLTVTAGITGSIQNAVTASYASYALTSSYSLGGSGFPFSGSAVITGSLLVSGSQTLTGSLSTTGPITASSVLATGTITAQTLIVQTVTSSIVYSSGSNIFGSQLTNTQTFTGSVNITGSAVNLKDGIFSGSGANLFGIPATGITGLNLSQIASGSASASISPNNGLVVNTNTRISGSTQITGSLGVTGSFSVSGSTGTVFSSNADSLLITGSLLVTGSAQITGSLSVSGSITGSLLGTASFALDAATLTGTGSIGFTTTASFNAVSSSQQSISASLLQVSASYIALSASYNTFSGSASTRITTISSSQQDISASQQQISASLLTVSRSYASTGSNTFVGLETITGSLIVTGSVAISTLVTSSGVRYVIADQNGLLSAQTASAAIFTTQQVVSTSGQTVFPITNGYSTGYVTVFVNGTKLSADEYVDTSGTNIIFLTGSTAGDVVEFQKYLPAAGVSNNTLRTVNYFTATLGQTNFTVNYTPGLLDVFYNGAKLDNTEYTAANGTSITLATGSNAGDRLEVDVYSYQVGAFSGIGGTGAANQLAYFNTSNSITGSNAFTVSGSAIIITGSLIVSGSGTLINIGPAVFSGSVTAVGGFSGSFSGNADSASLAQNSLLLQGTGSIGFATTASLLAVSSSQQQISSSLLTLTASFTALSSSYTSLSASYNTFSGSESTRITKIENNYATTGSNSFRANQSITGSLVVSSTITAQTLVVQTVTSSIVYSSGSNIFGSALGDRQTFTGSVNITGSVAIASAATYALDVTGTGRFTGALTAGATILNGLLNVGSGSVSSAAININSNNSTAAYLYFNGAGITNNHTAITGLEGATSNLKFYTANTLRLTIDSSGAATFTDNVLLPATKKLYLSGTSYIQEVTTGTIRLAPAGNDSFDITSTLLNIWVPITINSNRIAITGTDSELSMNATGGSSSSGYIQSYNPTLNQFKNLVLYGKDIIFLAQVSTDSEKMRITSGGNVLIYQNLGINTSDGSDNSYLSISGASDAGDHRGARIYLSGNERAVDAGNLVLAAGNSTSGTGAPGTIVFRVSTDLEKIRLTNEGFFKLSNTGVYNTAQSYHEIRSSGADWTCIFHNLNSSSPNGIPITYTTASPNGASNQFIYCNDSSTLRFTVKSNGGINNFQANDGNLSDERTKKDIAPLESYWNKFKDIEIVKFKYKDQTHDDFNIGVIAQQVEAVAPEFVDVDGWGEIPEDGIPLKSIYTADLNHTTIKVLQEAMAKIEELQEKLQRNNIN